MANAKRNKPKTLERYIWEKPNARHLWFRMAVPKRYWDVVGRRIIQKSLGTADKGEAVIKVARMFADLHEQWSALLPLEVVPSVAVESGTGYLVEPTLIDLQVTATEAAYAEVMGKLDALRRSKVIGNNEQYEAYLRSMREQLLRLVRTRETDALRLWQRVADNRIQRKGWLLPKEGERYSQFVEMIAEAGIEAVRVDLERRSGVAAAEPKSKVVAAGLQAKEDIAKPGETIMELFERYAAQRAAEKRKRADTINQDRKVIEQFATFIGQRRSIRSIEAADVRDWRDCLASLPPNFRKMKEYRDLSMQDAAARARKAGVKSVSPTTINKYLSTLSPLLSWCRTNSYADQNACEGLFYDIPKGRNPRPPFNVDQLNTILTSPLFSGFLRDGKEHQPGSVRTQDWRYWIPLVCMFTGARIGEIAQLRLEDIRHEDGEGHGVWFIHIRNDESTGQSTKSGFSRIAPVHSILKALGFLAFVERQRERSGKTGKPQLFPELEENARGQIGGKPSRFWRDYLSAIKVKSGGDGFGAHSFRHLMADQLRLADYLDDEIEVALGHNQKTVTGGYGKIKQGTVDRLSKMFESVKFKGVSFEHLIP